MIDFGTPIEDEHVKRLCEYFGYGAVMESAARQWKAKDPIGAKTVGDCCGAPSIPTGPELRERMINIIFEETAAGRNDTEDAADRILSLLPATPLDPLPNPLIKCGISEKCRYPQNHAQACTDSPMEPNGIRCHLCGWSISVDKCDNPACRAPAPKEEDVSAKRGPSALEVCRDLDEFQARYENQTRDKAPGNDYWAPQLLKIVAAARSALIQSSEALAEPSPSSPLPSPSLELREALTEAMDLLENWPLPKMGNPLREELAADRKALRERVRAISPQGSEAPAPGARPEAHPGNKPIPPHQMFPDSFGQEGPSHG